MHETDNKSNLLRYRFILTTTTKIYVLFHLNFLLLKIFMLLFFTKF